MMTQKNINGKVELRKFFIGAHPIIQVYLERLKVREIISSVIKQDLRLQVPIEQTLMVLVHNILTSPAPMYEIGDWLAPIDKSVLGIDDATLIQDDRLGKSMDSFYNGKHKEVFFRLALRAIKEFGLDCSQIHQDTTTVTLSGKYSNWSANEVLTYGKNKDHRPDLKQLVLGLSVCGDGAVPLVHKVYDGNQSDDILHPENHQKIRKLLGRSDFIYVADCKLATEGNLSKIALCNGFFVSIMPKTWSEDQDFRNKIRMGEQVKWVPLLKRKNNRRPDSKRDSYQLADGIYSAKGYTIYWIHSSQKAECDADTRNRHIEDSLDSLRELQSKLNRYSLKTEDGIKSAIRAILKKYQCEKWISFKIQTHQQEKVVYERAGRPALKEKGVRARTQQFSVDFSKNKQAIELEALTDGIFPLITNVPTELRKPKEILEIYKYQAFLEKNHSKIKTWQEATPVLLKKGERVVAYLHLHVIALMVSALIERQLKKALEKNKIDNLPLYPEGRHCPAPSIYDLVRTFKNVERYETIECAKVTVFPAQLTKTQRQVLKLLEVPVALYH